MRKFKFKSSKQDTNSCLTDEWIDKLVFDIVMPYIQRVQQRGLKNEIIDKVPYWDPDKMVIAALSKKLKAAKNIELGFGIGRITVQYRNGGVVIRPSGTAGWIMKEINIPDRKIIATVDDIIDQFQKKYIDDPTYITDRVREVIFNLSHEGIYKPKTKEEKTIYDLVILILVTYYTDSENTPIWLESAISNLEQVNIIESLLDLIIKHISSILGNISQNLYLNFKLVLDSWLVRLALNKKTNHGQLAGLLDLCNLDIETLINDFANDYMSPSFVTGMGQVVSGIASSFFYDNKNNIDKVDSDEEQNKGLPFQVTLTFGDNPKNQRAVRWYTSSDISNGCVEYASNKNFENSILIQAKCEKVVKPLTMINLGLLTTYAIKDVSKYSAVISDLKEDTTYWYRVGNTEKGLWSEPQPIRIPNTNNSFMFINLADSQGMVKDDYDVFTKVFEAAVKKFPDSSFISHLGDFVDDGNNEDYWSWLLNQKVWAGKTVVPVAGNHEAKLNSTVLKAGVENSIISHFNLRNIPDQDTSKGVYYSYIYRNTTFIVLNTNDINENDQLSDEQYNWAFETAKNATTKWKIILAHKSPYSNGPHHDDRDVKGISVQINMLVDVCKVDMVIAGHDHVYVRTPILSNMSRVICKTKTVKHHGIKYETAVNPQGALFIIPGTSGVKNYRQDLSAILPSEIVAQPDCPMYSVISIDDERIYFTAYIYDVSDGSSKLFDSFAIEKSNNEMIERYEKVTALISSLPKYVENTSRGLIDKIDNLYTKLSDSDKKRVIGYEKLVKAKEVLSAYEQISSKKSIVVSNKKEFVDAVNNENIGTIITNGNDIKFESRFGSGNRCIINRNLCIKGTSRLMKVCFYVKPGATLILSENISIDNTRKQGSIYRSLNNIELEDNSSLIINDSATLRTEYGLFDGGYCIKAHGKNISIYLNSMSSQWGSKGTLHSKNKNNLIIINDGSYINKQNCYTIESNSTLIIHGGRFKSIKTGKLSSTYINGGEIGYKDTDDKKPPLDLSGNTYITGCKVKRNQNTSILISGSTSRIYIQPDHDGAVNIGGNIPFIDKAKTFDYKRILVQLPNNYNNRVYTLPKNIISFSELTKSDGVRLISSDKDYLTANVPYGENYVYAKSLYSDSEDNRNFIECRNGAKVYLYNKIRSIENNNINSIKLINQHVTIPLRDDMDNAGTFKLYYNTFPLNAFNDGAYWWSDDETVVSVDQTGRVHAVGRGTTTIHAKLISDENISDFCTVDII